MIFKKTWKFICVFLFCGELKLGPFTNCDMFFPVLDLIFTTLDDLGEMRSRDISARSPLLMDELIIFVIENGDNWDLSEINRGRGVEIVNGMTKI